MSVLDYSKWDHIGDSESDEDMPQVHVSKLTEKTTFANGLTATPATKGSTQAQPSVVSSAAVSSKAAQGTAVDAYTRNGGQTNSYLWCQDERTCTVRLPVPKGTRAKFVRVKAQNQSLHVGVITPPNKQAVQCLEGKLAFPIDESDEALEDHWRLEDATLPLGQASKDHRCLVITLTKKTPVAGVVMWWNRVMQDDAPLDTTKFADRQNSGKSITSAWSEAHKLFKEKVAKIEKVDIPV